jgi:hypothetical protein
METDQVNRELAEHISALAAPIYAALIVRAVAPKEMVGDPVWQDQARSVAINLAHDLWLATLGTGK